ncbi:phosphohistidine phosphatase [Microbacterium halimionae]|uniref:Phosphohistidine phosphatase n=1 Tax=Microbacterium halimionae TaxID=1526413 RepID=A0A7W3JMZ3_9MICO|nr:histidine phosphatase family protein [Microbacterium halimionae]MBA8815734.1 phosphohistidine phosphatase [Microbacterium halimionae]NII95780.1 phosphohistidine phosphatase [Microbacterium halimionae]
MITLVLVRHAKSDWGNAFLDDHERPLNRRGQGDAPRMAERLAATFSAAGVKPDAIVSSTALRAATTADAFGHALGVDVTRDARLYGAPPRVLLEVASETDGSTAVIVAHDPGLSTLVERLTDGEVTEMPTCAVAVFEWNASDWASIDFDEPDRWTFDEPSAR